MSKRGAKYSNKFHGYKRKTYNEQKINYKKYYKENLKETVTDQWQFN